MPVSTLVLGPRWSSDSRVLRATARAAGWNTIRLADWEWDPPEPIDRRAVAVYGEPRLGEIVADALDVALFGPPIDWLVGVPVGYVHRDVAVSTLGEARSLAQPRFVKPCHRKSFPARVYRSGVRVRKARELPDAMPVLVAEPVTWEVEFRCFVAGGVRAAIAPYLRDGRPTQDPTGAWPTDDPALPEAAQFVDRLLTDERVRIPPAIVIDVGHISGRGWAVVEANEAWVAGVYGCDPGAVLAVLRHACVPAENVSFADKRWLSPLASADEYGPV